MTRLELMQLSQGLSDLYTGLETDLLANIAAFLTAEQADMPSAQWKIQMLAQLGALDRKNLRTITQYVKNVPRMLQDTLQAGVLSALEDLEPGFRQMVLDGILHGTDTPVEDTMARALKAYARQARKSMNMVNTVMRYKARDAAHKAINDTAELADKQEFLNALNKAAGKTVSGIESRQAAMRQCIKEMTDKGIPAFVDKRGREWSPEAYVNMAIRTTAANTAQQAQFDRMDDYGLNLVEVSSHSGARPKCAKDQGKIFNRSGGGGYTTDLHGRKIRYYAWSESSYGEPDGILGINCGHQIYPFTPGVSYQTYFPEPEEENAEAYKKSQQQRELERRVRKSKRECMMLETAGDPEGARQAQQLLKQRQDALRQFCGDNGLRYKPDRTAVADYKKSVAGYVPPDQTERIRKLNGEQYMSSAPNSWSSTQPTVHSQSELKEVREYAESKGIKLYHRKAFSGDTELLKSEIDMVHMLREDFGITDPITIGWKPMSEEDFAETSANHQQIWFNELVLRSRQITEANLSSDNVLATNSADGIAAHEMGHIISGKIRNGKSGLDIYKETVYNVSGKRVTDDEAIALLIEKVSIYSSFLTVKSNGTVAYHEIIPEMVSVNSTNPNKYSKEFVRLLKEACEL